jgi:Flp pilus assembly protein TadG
MRCFLRTRSGVVFRFLRGESAGPIVEFALIFPILLVVITGIIDLGRAYYTRNALVSAVREGARFASVQSNPCGISQTVATRVVNSFVPVGGAALTTGMVTVEPLPSTACGNSPVGRVESIRVRITGYTFTPITPVYQILSIATPSLSATAQFRWELSS